MRVLITGATGFVGTHLRRSLLSSTDWDLAGTVYPPPSPGSLEVESSGPPVSSGPSRESFYGLDLRDRDATDRVLREVEPDYIVHLAAQSHVPTAYENPWETLENNILGQLNLLESCVALRLKPRILIIGSGDEYGRAPAADLPLTEDHPLRPENPYSVSKVAQDVMGYQYFISYGLPVVRSRPFNHIGPGQSSRFVLSAFASQVAEIEAGKREPVLHVGNLTSARDFTDVRDVVQAYRVILSEGRDGEVYNIASGRAHTIQTLLDTLLDMATTQIEVRTDPARYRPSDIPIIYGSAEKLAQDTGWRPQIPLSQTIRDVLSEWRQRVAQPDAQD
jgi:GDP-4-dehydro-6-deoxy-D-mannose reductase